MNANTELHAAMSFLERGIRIRVRAPFLFRLVGIRTISLRIGKLYGGTLLRVSAYYLETGLKDEDIKDPGAERALEIMRDHGRSIYKAIAAALLNGKWRGRLFTRMLANYLLESMTMRDAMIALEVCLLYNGTADFMNITRLVRMMKITDPNPGQLAKPAKSKGS